MLTAVQADEFFGLRHAREALDLDPGYTPAQLVFINLTLSYTYAFEPDQFFLGKMNPALKQLLGSVSTDLLSTALERGLSEGNIRVILPIVQVLGERGDVSAALPTQQGPPRGLTRALDYPDRRVQFAAATALLKMPATSVPVASTRVVEVLTRFLSADLQPKALVAFAPKDRSGEVRSALKAAGFEPVLVSSIREAFEHLKQSAAFDVILLFPPASAGDFPHVIAQMRGDRDTRLMPLLIFADEKMRERLPRLTANYKNVWIVPDIVLTMPDDLKKTLEEDIKAAGGTKLSEKERKELTRSALDWLWRMAREELRGYDVRPAERAVVQALASEDLAVEALEVLGRIPGSDAQQRLAAFALDPAKSKLRVAAALELNRNIQKYGVVLTPPQLKGIQAVYRNPMEDAELRTQFSMVLGSLRPSATQTGVRLLGFQPAPQAAPEPAPQPAQK